MAATLLAVALILFTSSTLPLLGDYTEWTYHGVLLRDALQHHPDAAYTLKHYPVPNTLTIAGLGVLMLVFSVTTAAKLWILFIVLLGLYASYDLQRATGSPQLWKTLLISTAAALGGPFWFGFTNFILGTFFAMLFCARLLRGRSTFWPGTLLLLAAFLSHMIPWAFALLAIALWALQNKRPRALLAAVPSLLLCAWYFVARYSHNDADGKAGMVASVPYMTPLFAAFKLNTFLKSWGFVNPATTDTNSVLLQFTGAHAFLLLVLLDLVVAAAAAALLFLFARRSLRNASPTRFFWITVAIFVAAALLLPGAAAGISDPGGRMLQVAVWTAICIVSTHRRWLTTTLTASTAILLAANLWVMKSALMAAPQPGANTGLPQHIRTFGHVYYADRYRYAFAIESGQRNLPIYPTALFLRTAPKP